MPENPESGTKRSVEGLKPESLFHFGQHATSGESGLQYNEASGIKASGVSLTESRFQVTHHEVTDIQITGYYAAVLGNILISVTDPDGLICSSSDGV